jgi:hypothetical protein
MLPSKGHGKTNRASSGESYQTTARIKIFIEENFPAENVSRNRITNETLIPQIYDISFLFASKRLDCGKLICIYFIGGRCSPRLHGSRLFHLTFFSKLSMSKVSA